MRVIDIPHAVGAPRGRQHGIAADVIRIVARVDDADDWPGCARASCRGQQLGTRPPLASLRSSDARLHRRGRGRDPARKLTHGRKKLVGHLRAARVHEQHTVFPDGGDDVRACSAQEIDVPAHRQDPDLARGRLRLCAHARLGDPRQARENCDGECGQRTRGLIEHHLPQAQPRRPEPCSRAGRRRSTHSAAGSSDTRDIPSARHRSAPSAPDRIEPEGS